MKDDSAFIHVNFTKEIILSFRLGDYGKHSRRLRLGEYENVYRTLITGQSILRLRDPEVLCNTSCCRCLFS